MYLSEMFDITKCSRGGRYGDNMKYSNIITEGRSKDLEYTEKKVKGLVDRVTVTLGGQYSGIITKLANEYNELGATIDQLSQRRDELNLRAKEEGEYLFDAEDEVLTRVIDTVSATLTISKKIVDKKSSVDMDKVVSDLVELMPELKEKIDEIIKANTKITELEKSPRLTIKSKVSEAFEPMNVIKNFISKATAYFSNWSDSYKSRLDNILSQVQ